MKNILFSLICLTSISLGQTVNSIADQVLVELQTLSNSWKSIKDEPSAKASVVVSKTQAAKLVSLSKSLQKLRRPDNSIRAALKIRQAKATAAVSMEMATTLAMLKSDLAPMTILTKGLQDIEKDMAGSKKIFDLYFEPDVIVKKP